MDRLRRLSNRLSLPYPSSYAAETRPLILFRSVSFGTTPIALSAAFPLSKINTVGIERIPYWAAMPGFSSAFSFPTFACPASSPARFFDDRAKDATGTAPGCPEVHQDGLVALGNLFLEVLSGQCDVTLIVFRCIFSCMFSFTNRRLDSKQGAAGSGETRQSPERKRGVSEHGDRQNLDPSPELGPVTGVLGRVSC